jgi:uncharacterized protein involved in exopolysaccharide biosynthesis
MPEETPQHAGHGTQAPGADPDFGPEVSLVSLLTVLLRRRRVVIGIPLVLLALAVALHALRGRTYVAVSSFLPETERVMPAGLSGLAAQFGLSLPTSNSGESVDFYVELTRSPELLRGLAAHRFLVQAHPDDPDTLRGTLYDLLRIRGSTRTTREQAAVNGLRRLVVARPERRTGMVVVETRAPWPGLAEAMNSVLLEQISEFNLRRRQSRAAAERRFIEGRVQQAGTELQAAEAALAEFLRRNARYEQSPDLVVLHSRLQRRIDLQQQVYAGLVQAYEQARIEEVRNTPVITVVEPPQGTGKVAGSLGRSLMLALVVGGLIGVGAAFLGEHLADRLARAPQEIAALRQASRSLGASRLLDRLRGRGLPSHPATERKV